MREKDKGSAWAKTKMELVITKNQKEEDYEVE